MHSVALDTRFLSARSVNLSTRQPEPLLEILVLNQHEVAAQLPMADCMTAMEGALRALAEGDAQLPLRTIIRLPDGKSAFGAMPAYLGQPAAIGLKAITVFPGNEGSALDSHQGAVLLFEAEQGRLLAVMDASSITAIRTAAVSGVATRLLAREDARQLGLLGSGVQAWTHLEAMLVARPSIETVHVYSRNHGHSVRFARRAREQFGVQVSAVGEAADAVVRSDVVCTVTSSRLPVLEGAWLAPGAHVNAVGASLKDARELDTAAVRAARLYVDRRESALAEAGDVLIPMREGAFGEEHIIGELGELLLGRIEGRRAADEITLFKSLGLAVEDVAAAYVVYERATAAGVGTRVELGGERH